MTDPNSLRSLLVFWEPGQDPTFDQDGWALWELQALLYRCAEMVDERIEAAMAEAEEE